MDFWNDIVTDKSWEALLRIKKQFNFVLIGGWACYLYTKTMKSKDIDIIVDFDTLKIIENKYRLKKNQSLKRYEIVVNGISVDIYVPFFSNLAIPPEDIIKSAASVEGFSIPSPEMLVILKQEAERDRHGSGKGEKDRVDILNLLLKSQFNKDKYLSLLEKYNKNLLKHILDTIANSNKEFAYLGIDNPRKIKLLKKELLEGFSK